MSSADPSIVDVPESEMPLSEQGGTPWSDDYVCHYKECSKKAEDH